MVGFANAKINVGLHILSRRSDGYHEIETVFYPLYGLRDVVEVVRSTSTYIVNTGLEVDVPLEKNLVYRAYKLLKQDYDLGEVMFYLHKIVPMGAGLGGGSADAAQVLVLLNREFDLGLSDERLHEYARCLGADCSFFIYNKPMIAGGIGDLLEPIELDLENYNIVVVKPRFSIGTAVAYSLMRPQERDVSLRELVSRPVEEWKHIVVNDFEQVLFAHYPELEELKKRLYDMGALYVSLSGSGSAIYGIFNDSINLDTLGQGNEFVWQSKNNQI